MLSSGGGCECRAWNRQVHGFLLRTMHELAIRQTASKWAFAGSLPKCLAERSTRTSRPAINVIALLPFWTGLAVARLNSAYGRTRKDSRCNSLGGACPLRRLQAHLRRPTGRLLREAACDCVQVC